MKMLTLLNHYKNLKIFRLILLLWIGVCAEVSSAQEATQATEGTTRPIVTSAVQLSRCLDFSKDYALNIFESLSDFKLSKEYIFEVKPNQVTNFSLHLLNGQYQAWDLTQDMKFIKLRVASDYVDSAFEVIAMGVYADDRPLQLLRFKCQAITSEAVLISNDEIKVQDKKEATEVQNEQESYRRP